MRSFSGDQHSVVVKLHELTPVESENTPLFIVTGEAGVGKSLVLRTFARGLAIRKLNGHPESETLPFVFPLQQFDGVHSEALWDELSTSWIAWVNSLTASNIFTVKNWFEPRLKTDSTVLILDGVDEFLQNNASIKPEDFRKMILQLRKKYEGRAKVGIVLGIRTEASIFDVIREDADWILTVRTLTDIEARNYFADAVRLIDVVLQNRNRENVSSLGPVNKQAPSPIDTVLYSPLILSALEGGTLDLTDIPNRQNLRNRAEIYDLALTALLKKAKLVESFPDSSRQDWKIALMIIAMLFSSGHYGHMSRAEIRELAEKLRGDWRRHSWEDHTALGYSSRSLDNAFELLLQESTQTALLNRAVFFPAGRSSYRFKHRVWQDFLFGAYFSFCIYTVNLTEITRVAFTAHAFEIGGELLANAGWRGIDTPFASAVVDRMTKPYGQFVLGNLGGLIGNYFIPVTGSAIALLARHENEMPSTGKLTFIGGVGYRILVNDVRDTSLEDLKEHMIPILRACVQRGVEVAKTGESSGPSKLLASISWCYLSAYSREFVDLSLMPAIPWTPLSMTDEEEKCILDGLLGCRMAGQFMSPVPLIFHTVQYAYLAIQDDGLETDDRLIATIHYLYTLTLACKHGIARDEILSSVYEILDSRSPIGQKFVNSTFKSIADIYRYCQGLLLKNIVT
jgi:hypothetical protein